MAKQILLVEDDADVAALIASAAAYEGWHVEVARDGADARNAWRRVQPDLLVIDLRLPGGTDGIDVYQQARRELGRRPQAIFVSAADEAPSAARALNVPLIAKPFAINDLLSTFRRLLA